MACVTVTMEGGTEEVGVAGDGGKEGGNEAEADVENGQPRSPRCLWRDDCEP